MNGEEGERSGERGGEGKGEKRRFALVVGEKEIAEE